MLNQAPTTQDVRRATMPARQPSFAVHLGPLSYRLAWVGIYSIHAACALYCFGAAMLFRETQDSLMVAHFALFHTIIDPRFFPVVSIGHFVVGAIHACFVVEPMVLATYAVLAKAHDRLTGRTASRTSSLFASRIASLPQSLAQHLPRTLKSVAYAAYARIFARHGLLGIESRHFDSLLLARELVESGLQAYQASQMCRYLSRQWLNRLFVATLILNCWITPILHHFVVNKPLRRLLDRVSDVVLDFLATVGVPFAIVVSYWSQIDPTTRTFFSDLWADDVWATRLRTESPLVFFGSWMDAASRLMFALGLLLSLDDVKILLRRRLNNLSAIRPYEPKAEPKSRRPSVTASVLAAKSLHMGHRLLFAFGAVLLGIHLHSELRMRPLACLLELRPWLEPKPTCAFVEFSCYTNRNFTGIANEFDLVLAYLNPTVLAHICFRHCRAVTFQPSVQQFSNLLSLKVYNSTVADWPARAALTNASHPKLAWINFARTEFPNGSLPDCLRSPTFPRAVTEAFFSVTNLEHLPETLDWPPSMALFFEFSPLREFPIAFIDTKPLVLSLEANALTNVPREVFEVPGLFCLAVSGNPISALPDDVVLSGMLGVIAMDSTNVSTMPAWLLDAATMGQTYVSAGLTPYCEGLASGGDTASSNVGDSSLETTEVGLESTSPIDCTDSGTVQGVYQQAIDVRATEVW